MPTKATIASTANALSKLASSKVDRAQAALLVALRKLQAEVAVGLSAQDGWAFTDYTRAVSIFERALADSGVQNIANKFGEAATAYAEKFNSEGIVTFMGADTRAISAALNAKYDGWGEQLGDLKGWLHDRLAMQTLSAIPTRALVAEAMGYIGGDLQRHANTYIETAMQSQLRAMWAIAGRQGEAKTYHYEGPDDDKTRDFCAKLLEDGGELTEEEIHALDNGQGMDAFEAGGGWNCRHMWIPRFFSLDDNAPEEEPPPPDAAPDWNEAEDYGWAIPEDIVSALKGQYSPFDVLGSGYGVGEAASINRYIEGSFELNEYLRGTGFAFKEMPKDLQLLQNSLDKSIARQSMKEDTILYRGITKDPKWSIGQVFQDKGFVSTSLSQGFTESWISDEPGGAIARILTPKGVNVIPIVMGKGGSNQLEMLLPRGMEFRVVRVFAAKAADGQKIYDLEIVPTKALTAKAEALNPVDVWAKAIMAGEDTSGLPMLFQEEQDALEARLAKMRPGKAAPAIEGLPKRWQKVLDAATDFKDAEGSDDRVEEYIRKTIGDFTAKEKGFTSQELSSIINYAENDFETVNRFLREGPAFMDDVGLPHRYATQLIESLDSAMGRQVLHENTVLYRGGIDPHLGVGARFTDKAFVSTSLSRSVAESFVDDILYAPGESGAVFKVVAFADQPVVGIGAAQSLLGKTNFATMPELEVLLPRGLTFRVIGIEGTPIVPTYILEIVK